jgi:hypothetical protein
MKSIDPGKAELVQELANVFGMGREAQALLELIGFPRSHLPSGAHSAVEFWNAAAREIAAGLVEGGLLSLLDAAQKTYPWNAVFAQWAEGLRARRPDQAGAEPRLSLIVTGHGDDVFGTINRVRHLAQDAAVEIGWANRESIQFLLPGLAEERALDLAKEIERHGDGLRAKVARTPFRDYLQRLQVEGPDQARFELADIPTSTRVRDIARAIILKYGPDAWPRDPSGSARPAVVDFISPDGAVKRVDPGQTIQESGIGDGDTLHIAPESTAGRFPAETQVSLGEGSSDRPAVFDFISPDGAVKRVDPGQTIHESEIGDGDILHMAPESTAGCFPAETQVSLWEGGSRPIAQIRPGDVVLSGMPECPQPALVRRIFHGTTERLLVLDGRLRLTPSHPVLAGGRWVPAGCLLPGDLLVAQSGERLPLRRIEPAGGATPIFNLHLESDDHTFFAEGVLVHNMDSKVWIADEASLRDLGDVSSPPQPPQRLPGLVRDDRHATPPPPTHLTRDDRGALPGFHTDVPADEDLLGIRGEVEALASLVAAWSVEPPLSIGLFGDWGWGKSFFLRQLRARVARLTAGARQSGAPQREVAFCKDIVQIEFNAWHYAEGNLWASLVEHIFTHLGREDAVDGTQVRRDLLDQMGIAEEIKSRVRGQLQTLELARDEARSRFEEARESHERLAARLAARQAASAWSQVLISPDEHQQEMLARLGLPPEVCKSARALRDALRDVRTLDGRARAMVASIFAGLKRPRQFAWLLAVILAAPAAVLLLSWIERLTGWQIWSLLSRGAVQIATLLAGGTAWIRHQADRATEALRAVEPMRAKIEEQVDRAEAVRTREIAEIEASLANLTSEHDEVARRYEEAERRIRDLQAELDGLDPGRMLAAFIEDRAACSDYRRHLGVVALIRRDFEKLARLFAKQREEERSGIPPPDRATINRIVLYVDDLDRCPPARVVEVLQAIHLLLAFPLFVVIVAVDARWVSRSLQEHYGSLLGRQPSGDGARAHDLDRSGAAVPEDYLEKIFQIPYWLRPMNHDHCAELLDGLTRDSLARPRTEPPPAPDGLPPAGLTPPDGNPPPARPRLVPSPADPPPAAGGRLASPSGEGSEPPEAPAAERLDLSPRKLEIEAEELAFMKRLAPLIGRSPRNVKRFLNCYRLIRAGLRAEVRPRTASGPEDSSFNYRAIMLLLAVVTGEREVAEPFAQSLVLRQATDSFDEFVRQLEEDPAVSHHPAMGRLRGALTLYRDSSGRDEDRSSLASLRQALPEVVRYSFRSIVLPQPPPS